MQLRDIPGRIVTVYQAHFYQTALFTTAISLVSVVLSFGGMLPFDPTPIILITILFDFLAINKHFDSIRWGAVSSEAKPQTVVSITDLPPEKQREGAKVEVQGRPGKITSIIGQRARINYIDTPSLTSDWRTLLASSIFFLSLFIFLMNSRTLFFAQLGLTPIFAFFDWIDSTWLPQAAIYTLVGSLLSYVLYLIKYNKIDFESKFPTEPVNAVESIRKYFLDNKYDFILSIAVFGLAFAVRYQSIHFQTGFTDNFMNPVVAVQMLQNSLFIYSDSGFPLAFNAITPSGRTYWRGLPYTLSLAASFSVFGFTDFATHIPGIVFGSISTAVLYFLSKEIVNRHVAAVASVIFAVSGFAVAIDTHIRHYVLYVLLLLTSILFYTRLDRNKDIKSLLFLSLTLSVLLFTHRQSILFISFILVFTYVSLFQPGYRHLFKPVSTIALGAVPIYLLLNPFQDSRSGFIQMAAYHADISWLFVWLLVLFGSYIIIQRENGPETVLLFYVLMMVFPFLLSVIDKDYFVRYGGVFYPLFVLFSTTALYTVAERIWNQLGERSSNHLARPNRKALTVGLVALVLVLANGFVLPLSSYTKPDIWPDRYDQSAEEMPKHPFVQFEQDYERVREASAGTNESVIVLSDDPWAAHWYTNINSETKTENHIAIWLAHYENLETWSFTKSNPNYAGNNRFDVSKEEPNYTVNHQYDEIPLNVSRFSLHNGIPVVTSSEQLERLQEKYDCGYVIFSDYNYRSGYLYTYSKDNFKMLSNDTDNARMHQYTTENTGVYYWGNCS